MKPIVQVVYILLFLIFLDFTPYAYAADRISDDKPAPFIDLDGDGINDNAPDSNGDGIPDFSNPSKTMPKDRVNSALGDVFNSPEFASKSELDNLKSCCDRFAERKFKVRAMTLHRIGLNGTDPFGSGIGIGSAASGACAGGVCH
jgi:hypothetical protein